MNYRANDGISNVMTNHPSVFQVLRTHTSTSISCRRSATVSQALIKVKSVSSRSAADGDIFYGYMVRSLFYQKAMREACSIFGTTDFEGPEPA